IGSQLIQGFLGLRRQSRLVETKMHGGFRDWPIIVQVRNLVAQRVQPGGCLAGYLLCLVGALSRSKRLLVSFRCLGGHTPDSLLRAGINILDVARGLGSNVVQFVGLVDDGSYFLTDIALGGATSAENNSTGN